jgi:hypothetical protein
MYVVYLHLQIYNPIIIVPTFFRQLFSQQSPSHLYFGNFAPQPDEEAGSAEEQPASNMAVPTLKAVDERAALPMDGSLYSDGPVR